MSVELRRFGPDDWATYQGIRLTALLSDPRVFLSSHAREVGRTEAELRARLANPSSASFGVLVDGALVGLTVAYVPADEPTIAVLAASWLEPAVRGRGLSRELYAARLAWIRTRPGVTRVRVSHREGNDASRRANQAFGFVFVGRHPIAWPDGTVEDEVCYELELG